MSENDIIRPDVPSRTIKAKITYGGKAKPLPVEDDMPDTPELKPCPWTDPPGPYAHKHVAEPQTRHTNTYEDEGRKIYEYGSQVICSCEATGPKVYCCSPDRAKALAGANEAAIAAWNSWGEVKNEGA